jgi:hypothetical protein
MPALQYDRDSDELGLLRPRQAPLDAALAELTGQFAGSRDRTRAARRRSISMDEFYTLLAFSRRSAVFALRERNAGWVTAGLTALAMIEAARIDWRDLLWALSILHHAAGRIGADADRLLQDAGRLAEPGVARLIDGFSRGSAKEKDLRSSWGHDEVEIDSQVGLIGWGFRPYQPTRDLSRAAVEIADFVGRRQYRADSVEIASELPAVWLETADNAALAKAMKRIRACATVHARLRAAEHRGCDSQMFIVFLAETADEAAAETRRKLSREKQPESYAMLGVREKNLFCLVVARSVVCGVASVETAEKLRRFSGGLTDILRRYTR